MAACFVFYLEAREIESNTLLPDIELLKMSVTQIEISSSPFLVSEE
jgi:hypothetical protein